MAQPPFAVVPAAPLLPDRLRALAAAADAEGIRNVTTLLARWEDGTERYDGSGEAVLVAVDGDGPAGEVLGVGALGRCPDVAGALRVRRFYVAGSVRRRGVARALAEALVRIGFAHTDVLTCNARASDAAAPFWEALGFEPVARPGITHLRRR